MDRVRKIGRIEQISEIGINSVSFGVAKALSLSLSSSAVSEQSISIINRQSLGCGVF